jgi:hypothetical protein
LHDLIATISFSAILARLRCIHDDFFAWRYVKALLRTLWTERTA